jgi:hypothetical protein
MRPNGALVRNSGRCFWSCDADALEEAGCANAAILTHLRGPKVHARGCWAMDLLLGKE